MHVQPDDSDISTPELIQKFLEDEGMTPAQLAASLNVAETTVHRWLKGEAKPTGTAAAILWTLIGLGSLALGVAGATGLLGGASVAARLLRSASVGAGALASGIGIYRLLKSKLERAETAEGLDALLEQEIEAIKARERQEEKVKTLRARLEEEERKLRELEQMTRRG